MPDSLKIEKTEIEGLYIISSKVVEDNRGCFTKVFQKEAFKDIVNQEFKEIYYSVSSRNVIRGMHFQVPPYAHTKLVYVPNGSIQDVVLDIREDSKTYGKYFSVELNDSNRWGLIVPIGLAHGFLSLKENTIVCYHQTTEYKSDFDKGIHWNSFSFNWGINNPIISKRDSNFDTFKEYSEKNKSIFINERT
jgi:dTDP-4-dehydrorhamnose 3,5-epimerase